MKLRPILNGIAALTAIGSFYTFAFLMVDDVDTAQISSDYYYSTATQTAPVQTVHSAESVNRPEENNPTGDVSPEIPDKPDLTPEVYITEENNNTPAAVVYETAADIQGGTANVESPVQTEATYVPKQENDIEYTENVSPVITEPRPVQKDDTDYDSFPEETGEDLIFSENNISEAVVGDQSAYADSEDADPDLLSELDRMASEAEIQQNLNSMQQAVSETEPYIFTMPYDNYNGVSSFGTYFETVPSMTEFTQPETELTTISPDGREILTAKVGGKTSEYDAYELVCMIVSTEMSPTFSTEALKAQAVAAYSYVKYHNEKGLVPSVLTKSEIPDEVRSAVSAVWGKCCYYNGNVAQTVYTASTAGTTASAVNVWGGENVPYLTSITTPFDIQSDPNYGVITTFSEDYIRKSLEKGLGITLSDNPYNWMVITSRVDGNYVSGVNIDGQTTISGRKIREQILGFGIKSWCFDVSYADGEFTFVTYGYGHGVGMSQNGANILAKQGSTYDQILLYYFPGIEIR